MTADITPVLTERQLRELEYHRDHAQKCQHLVNHTVDQDLIGAVQRRWWNHYWDMYSYFRALDLHGKSVLVDGCGFGTDVLSLQAMGAAHVEGNDLSPESVMIAEQRARQLKLDNVSFAVAPCETLPYADATFDIVVFYDILHHVDIPRALTEARRVMKPGGRIIIGEPYTHAVTQRLLRKNVVVEKLLYPLMRKFIYQTDNPYITEDERKLDEQELDYLKSQIDLETFSYFYVLLTRLVPARFTWFARADRLLCKALGPLGRYVSGRFFLAGRFRA